VAGHERDFCAGQKFFYFLEKLKTGHVRHDHVTEDHVNGLLFEQSQSGLAAIGLEADEAQGFAHGDAELADALLVIDDKKADAEVFSIQSGLA
jgi:hypothetical protein